MASCQIASGAVPTPPPTSSGVRPSRGGAKPIPNGPAIHRPSPGAQLAQPGRARPDGLEHELEAAARCDASRENARGRNGRSSAPPPQRSAAASM